jgi:hypothetical protein
VWDCEGVDRLRRAFEAISDDKQTGDRERRYLLRENDVGHQHDPTTPTRTSPAYLTLADHFVTLFSSARRCGVAQKRNSVEANGTKCDIGRQVVHLPGRAWTSAGSVLPLVLQGLGPGLWVFGSRMPNGGTLGYP